MIVLSFIALIKKQEKSLYFIWCIQEKGPRDFNIIDDRYIVVASQERRLFRLYTFDEEKEEIKPTEILLDIIQPVCVAL